VQQGDGAANATGRATVNCGGQSAPHQMQGKLWPRTLCQFQLLWRRRWGPSQEQGQPILLEHSIQELQDLSTMNGRDYGPDI
jgi:hypothetical protein